MVSRTLQRRTCFSLCLVSFSVSRRYLCNFYFTDDLQLLRQDVLGTIVVGDLNCHNSRWLRFSTSVSTEGRCLQRVCVTNGLLQKLQEPTQQQFLLYLCLTDMNEVTACVLPCIADHHCVDVYGQCERFCTQPSQCGTSVLQIGQLRVNMLRRLTSPLLILNVWTQLLKDLLTWFCLYETLLSQSVFYLKNLAAILGLLNVVVSLWLLSKLLLALTIMLHSVCFVLLS